MSYADASHCAKYGESASADAHSSRVFGRERSFQVAITLTASFKRVCATASRLH